MIRSRIQIEDGEIWDFQERFGFIYLDADERTAADEKEDAVSSYAGEAGEHRDGRTVEAPFDYKVKFLVEAKNSDVANVNVLIYTFNDAIRESVDGTSDVKRKKEITFYNDYNGVMIVGYPEVVSVPEEVYHSRVYGDLDFAVIELKIRVSDPRKCIFNLQS